MHSMKENWNKRAEIDARHFIATTQENWEKSEFFAKGREELFQLVSPFFRKYSFDLNGKRALEIGCGIGRQTRALSEMFDKVVGVDVSDQMIAIAKRLNHDLSNTVFIENNGRDLCNFQDASFDYVFSYATFQHIPEKSIVVNYFNEIHRVLRKGGLFQIHLRRKHRYHEFGLAFRFIPLPRPIISLAPGYMLDMYQYIIATASRKPRDMLKTGKTWRGVSFTKNESKRLVESAGLTLLEYSEEIDSVTGPRIWCFGMKEQTQRKLPRIFTKE